MKTTQGVCLARLLVDALEEDSVGRVSGSDDRHAQQNIQETESSDSSVNERSRRGRDDESKTGPEITVAPEASEGARLPKSVHGRKRHAIQNVMRRGHGRERN